MGYEKPPPKLTFYKAFFSAQWKFLIHTLVQCLSTKRTVWNEFSCFMASAIICLATCRKFNFSKYIFDSMVRNVDSPRGCIQTRGKIAAIDADEGITLVDVEKDEEGITLVDVKTDEEEVAIDAESQGGRILMLLNMAGYKIDFFKGMSYDETRPIFEREYNKVHTLFKQDKDVQQTKKKRVADETLLQESFKKLRAAEVSISESTQEIPTDDPK
nr:glutamic acid-rich protein-like [Tanacetum cinerariifolium]